MKRIVLLFFVFALTVVAGTAFAATLKLGSMSPLTGPYAADGNDIANGVRTAIAVVEAEGGIPGFDAIELSAQDTACDPRQAVATANKLINEGVVAVIGTYCSIATIPSSETLDEEDIIMLTPGATAESVTERGLRNIFRTCGRDDDQSKAAVAFMKNYLKAKTLYLVDDKTAYSQGLANNVEKDSPAAGLTVLGHEHVNQGDKDFSAVLTKVKAANPDVFYISLQNSATGALMAIQAKRMGITAAYLAQDAVYHPQLVKIAKEAVNGMYLTFGYVNHDSASYQRFIKAYQPKYGKPGAYSAYAYDSAMAYLLAVKKAGTTDYEKVRAALLSIEFDGASKRFRYKENGDSGSNYVIQKIEDGKFIDFWNVQTGKAF